METSKSLLFAERPYVAILTRVNTFSLRKFCWSCFKMTQCFRCAKCQIAVYCSKQCQRRDWMTKQHKYECEVFAKAPNELRGFLFEDFRKSADLRFVGRVLARKHNDGGIQPEEDRIKFPENVVVKSLLDVPTAPNADRFAAFGALQFDVNRFVDFFKTSYAALSDFYGKIEDSEILYAYTLLRSVAKIEDLNTEIVKRNGITDIEHPGKNILGVALFLQMTRFRYSCDPDVVRIEENGISYFKLIKPDKEGLDLDLLTTNFDIYGPELIKIVNNENFKRRISDLYPEGKDSPYSLLEADCSFCNSKMPKDDYFLREECSTCNQSLVFQLESNSVVCSRCDLAIPVGRKKIKTLKDAVGVVKRSELSTDNLSQITKVLHPVRNHNVFIFMLDLLQKILELDLLSVVLPGSFVPGSNRVICNCHLDSEGEGWIWKICEICVEHDDLQRRVLGFDFALLCNSLDPEKIEIKKFGDRLRHREHGAWIIPLMEIVLRGLDYYGLQMEDFIQLRQDISEIYARLGLKAEALEIAARARETLVMCYYESDYRVKEFDAHLKKITEME